MASTNYIIQRYGKQVLVNINNVCILVFVGTYIYEL